MQHSTLGADTSKRLQQLTGILSGVLADGALTDGEILYLKTWLTQNQDLQHAWPASEIHRRVFEVMSDGQVTEDERQSLVTLLQSIAPDNFSETGSADMEPITLPVDDVAELKISGLTVCHTGTFFFGSRTKCEQATSQAGGNPVERVTNKLDILVIGSMVSHSWANTSYGRKIEAAAKLKDEGKPVLIVTEQAWLRAIRTP